MNGAIPFGERISDGRIVTAIETPRGEACGCVCPECQEPLLAHQGGKIAWHFQHKPDIERWCGFGGETGLHKFAKQIIADKQSIYLPPLDAIAPGQFRRAFRRPRWAPIRNVRLEQRITAVAKSGFIVPDIIAAVGKRVEKEAVWSDTLIEIFVSHPTTIEKRKFLSEYRLPAFEINLSGLVNNPAIERYSGTSDILRDAPRYWLWHPEQDEVNAEFAEQIKQRQLLESKLREQMGRLSLRNVEQQRFREQLEKDKARKYEEWGLTNNISHYETANARDIEAKRREREKWVADCTEWMRRHSLHDPTLAPEITEWNRDWRERI